MIHGSLVFCFCIWLLDDFAEPQQGFSQNPMNMKQTFNTSAVKDVFNVETDEMKTVSVMEGESVTLNTDDIEILRDDQILWKFGPQETRIAELFKRNSINFESVSNDGIFKDRLHLDNQTGSLTITNTNKAHSGLYKQLMINGGVKQKKFSVAVYAHLTIPVITNISDPSLKPSISVRSSSQNCSLLCSVMNVTHVTLSWYKGNSLLSSISVSEFSTTLSLPLEVVCLDDSYRCVVAHSFTNQTKHRNVTNFCQPCSEQRQNLFMWLIIAGLVLLVVATVGVTVYHCRNQKKAKQQAQTNEQEMHYADTTFHRRTAQNPEADGEDQTVYSSVIMR